MGCTNLQLFPNLWNDLTPVVDNLLQGRKLVLYKEKKMKKRIVIFLIVVLMVVSLSACTILQNQAVSDQAADVPESGMPNPASVFCEQSGNKLEIRTASDGSQSGVCIFQDGSTCDEWAYFKGKCGPTPQKNLTPAATDEATLNASGGYMQPGTSEEFSNWWGVIKSIEPGAQYDDFFERQDMGGVIYFGIDSLDPAVQAQIEALRDSGKIVHLYGILFSNVPDYNGSQVQVSRIEIEE